jgi:hypothetical protein
MIPLTVDPTVVILIDADGEPREIATNVASDLKVVTTKSAAEFDELAKGRPFVQDLTPVPEGVERIPVAELLKP